MLFPNNITLYHVFRSCCSSYCEYMKTSPNSSLISSPELYTNEVPSGIVIALRLSKSKKILRSLLIDARKVTSEQPLCNICTYLNRLLKLQKTDLFFIWIALFHFIICTISRFVFFLLLNLPSLLLI